VAAVALADADGVQGVSMRRLADDLDVVPMALYKHVADKEDLLDGMVDTVIGEFCPPRTPTPVGDWRAAAKHLIDAARASVVAHPWVRQVIETRTRRTPAVLHHMEQLTQALLAGGLSPDLVHHSMHALGNRIWGFSPELFNHSGRASPPTRPAAPQPTPANYPGIAAIAADATVRRPGAVGCDEAFEFDFALDLLLDGIDRLHRSGWSSPLTR
jgi:AcrR family transcriptional regulator